MSGIERIVSLHSTQLQCTINARKRAQPTAANETMGGSPILEILPPKATSTQAKAAMLINQHYMSKLAKYKFSKLALLSDFPIMDPAVGSSSTAKPFKAAKACLCSPTAHPGSFRCKLHRKNCSGKPGSPEAKDGAPAKATSIRALLVQMIKPSNHDACRRRDFEPRPSRFSMINGNDRQAVVTV